MGHDFRADMGFMPQVDYTFLLAGLRRIWYGDRWSKTTFGGDWDRREDQSGQLLEEEIEANVEISGPLQSYISIGGGHRDRTYNGVRLPGSFVYGFAEADFTGSLYGSLDGGNLFTANLSQLTTVYQFNVRTFVRAIFQYTQIDRTPELYTALDPADVDPESERLFTQLLFSYKLNPQTVFFLGYSDVALADQRIDLTKENRTFFLKLGYAWLP